MSYKAKGAADTDPRWTPNWFDPLGRDRRVRREAAPPVEVVEEPDGSITIISRNTT